MIETLGSAGALKAGIFSFFFLAFGISACDAGEQKGNDPTNSENFSLFSKTPEKGVIEINGLCEKDGGIQPCPISDMPKYYRQLVDYNVDLPYAVVPNTINSFNMLSHIRAGYLVPDKIGFKYTEDLNPGYAGIAKYEAGLDEEVTLFEVFFQNPDQFRNLKLERLGSEPNLSY